MFQERCYERDGDINNTFFAENITNVRAEIENSSSSNEFSNGIDEVQDEEKKLDDYTTNKKSE